MNNDRLNNKRNFGWIAAVLLAAAAFFVFRGNFDSLTDTKLTLTADETSAESGGSEAAGEENAALQEQTGTEQTGQQGFTEQQKQELEELIGKCMEQQLESSVSAAVSEALASNLNEMMADGRLAQGVARYQEVQSGLVNINTAGVSELTQLSGIGEARAQAILKYREEHGDFSSVDELANVSGISSGIVEKLRDQATL